MNNLKTKKMKAPTGYYRKLIKDSNIRIALTHTPIIGCTVIDNTSIINDLENSNDEYANYYLEGLKNGSMVAIVENNYTEQYFAPGELYFKS